MIVGIHHFAIIVSYEKSVEFYTRLVLRNFFEKSVRTIMLFLWKDMESRLNYL